MGSFPAVWALWYWQLSYTSLVKPKSDIFTKWSSHTRILRVARSRWMNFFCDKYSWNRMNSARYFRVHRRRRHLHPDHDCFLLLTIERMWNVYEIHMYCGCRCDHRSIVEALIFFRLLPSNCLNWKIYWDDHSSLSSTTAVHINLIYISHHFTTREHMKSTNWPRS